MTLMRGLADDLPLMIWLQEHIWPVEAAVIGPEFVADGVELAIAEMLRGGTTCANENYFFPDVIGRDLSPVRLPRAGRPAGDRFPDAPGRRPATNTSSAPAKCTTTSAASR